jgi:Gpi18-like mannosyltransferase
MTRSPYFVPIKIERALWQLGKIATLWLAYTLTIEAVARVLLRDPLHKAVPEFEDSLHHFVGPASELPSLCRWDCAWYVTIAKGPYPGTGEAAHNVAFFPFYGLVMRAVSWLFHIEPAWAAARISRVALLGSMILLFEVGRAFGLKERERWAAVVALLCSPDAFVLLGGYADGLFLFLSLAAFWLALRNHPLLAMIPAACAGITRIHAFPFIVCLGVFGLIRAWKAPDKKRGLLELAPAVACGCAVLGLMIYFQRTVKDPIVFVHEQHFFGKSAGGPKMAWDALVGTWRDQMPPDSLGNLYWGLQSVIAVVWCGTIAVLAYTRSWVALAYVTAAYAMALSSGTHWGGWRYLAEVFPTWFAIARLRRWPALWSGWLFAGAALQFCFLINFVANRPPGP